jgi:hypothetical protein
MSTLKFYVDNNNNNNILIYVGILDCLYGLEVSVPGCKPTGSLPGATRFSE